METPPSPCSNRPDVCARGRAGRTTRQGCPSAGPGLVAGGTHGVWQPDGESGLSRGPGRRAMAGRGQASAGDSVHLSWGPVGKAPRLQEVKTCPCVYFCWLQQCIIICQHVRCGFICALKIASSGRMQTLYSTLENVPAAQNSLSKYFTLLISAFN